MKKYIGCEDKLDFFFRTINNLQVLVLMCKSDNSANNSKCGSDAHKRIALALAIMTDALQGSPRGLKLKTHLNEYE